MGMSLNLNPSVTETTFHADPLVTSQDAGKITIWAMWEPTFMEELENNWSPFVDGREPEASILIEYDPTHHERSADKWPSEILRVDPTNKLRKFARFVRGYSGTRRAKAAPVGQAKPNALVSRGTVQQRMASSSSGGKRPESGRGTSRHFDFDQAHLSSIAPTKPSVRASSSGSRQSSGDLQQTLTNYDFGAPRHDPADRDGTPPSSSEAFPSARRFSRRLRPSEQGNADSAEVRAITEHGQSRAA